VKEKYLAYLSVYKILATDLRSDFVRIIFISKSQY